MKAYNKMYDKKGKQIGRAYIVDSKSIKETTDQFKKRVKKDNSKWNRQNKSGHKVKAVKFGKKYY